VGQVLVNRKPSSDFVWLIPRVYTAASLEHLCSQLSGWVLEVHTWLIATDRSVVPSCY